MGKDKIFLVDLTGFILSQNGVVHPWVAGMTLLLPTYHEVLEKKAGIQ